ncbi:MAG: cation:proton antiporter [Flavobacteriales bacterium]|nr:cation:proton antiporter [Flavobacteriales bacterium]
MSAYELIIAGSGAIVLSYVYGELAKRTNIPSVLMLIVTGIVIGQLYPVNQESLFQPLEVLGIIGLIMIVLEGALDLELSKEKLPLIRKSLIVASLGIVGSMIAIGFPLYYLFEMSIGQSLLYATPLSVISSAIVIPSVNNLKGDKKEFLIYESCISDILGIMVFYFIIGLSESPNKANAVADFALNLILTIVISVMSGLGLVILFKYIRTSVKIFLFIAILILLYAVEKMLHLSPLILILFFGLMLKNHELVFRGRLANLATRMELRLMERNFHIITRETAFVLRTFFFIVFGLSMVLESLLDVLSLAISVLITASIYFVRRLLIRKNFKEGSEYVLLTMAPRGLITVLLYYSIPAEFKTSQFPESILLFIILFTSGVMSYGLIMRKKDAEVPVRVPNRNP